MTEEIMTLQYAEGMQAGKESELNRIIALIEKTPFIWMGDTQLIQISRDQLIKEIIGERNE